MSDNTGPVKIRCCAASGCRSAGSEGLHRALVAARDAAGIGGDAMVIKSVGCLRLCGRGPLVACDGATGTQLYGGVPPEQAQDLITALTNTPRQSTGTVEEEAPPLASHRLDLEHPFFRLQHAVVLEGCGQLDPESIQDAIAHGAYAQLRKVLLSRSPEEVREEIRRSGLRGRGGAGYPTGLKWDTVALQPPGPRFVVCNGDEGDPGAFMDRSVMEGDPHRLLEGMAIAAYAVGADRGYIYVRAEYPLAIERLRRALQQARQKGLLGNGIAGTPFSLRLEVRVGAGAYVCGEETALLHSIAGERGTPRPRPPYPAQVGLEGAPTLINNVETYTAVPAILREGGAWYAGIGTEGSRGTKVFALSGAIANTGLVEVPMGTPLRTVVETMGVVCPVGDP